MFKILFISLLSVIAIQYIPVHITPENLPLEAVQVEPIASPNQQRITINCDSTCNTKEREELPGLVNLLLTIQSSQCFNNYLRTHNLDMGQTNNLTLQQVIDMVTTNKVQTTLTYYYQGKNWFTKNLVVGYENGDGKVHANRAAWNYMSSCEKASNLAHELTHGKPMEFTHDYRNTKRRPFSVPYVVGSAIIACCKI